MEVVVEVVMEEEIGVLELGRAFHIMVSVHQVPKHCIFQLGVLGLVFDLGVLGWLVFLEVFEVGVLG